MLKRMSSRTLTEWMAYNRLEPFGDELLDIHFAELKAIVANANRKKGSAAIEPKKFRLWEEIREFDAQEFFDRLKSVFGK